MDSTSIMACFHSTAIQHWLFILTFCVSGQKKSVLGVSVMTTSPMAISLVATTFLPLSMSTATSTQSAKEGKRGFRELISGGLIFGSRLLRLKNKIL